MNTREAIGIICVDLALPTTRLFMVVLFTIMTITGTAIGAVPKSELLPGFRTTPDHNGPKIQEILRDQSGNFSLAFLRLNDDDTSSSICLALAVVHLPSGEPLWQAAQWSTATTSTSASTSTSTCTSPSLSVSLSFNNNGSLVLQSAAATGGGVGRPTIWSTPGGGNRVVLRNSSNLQVILTNNNELDPVPKGKAAVIWQSFDFPGDTLVEGQNLTSPGTLRSSNGLYTLRLESNYIGLYADFNNTTTTSTTTNNNKRKLQIYYQHRALEVRARIVEGRGPVTLRISPEGYLGMYQPINSTTPADLQPFNTYQYHTSTSTSTRTRAKGMIPPESAVLFRLIRLEPDGNLKGYYWSGSESRWVMDYQAITEPCELPSPCGPYGLCMPGKPENYCSSLDDQPVITGWSSAAGDHEYCCYPNNHQGSSSFTVIRKAGVDLPSFKELMGYVQTASFDECQKACESNCSCWGAVYNNATRFCYSLDYPIQTLVASGDTTNKLAYFKKLITNTTRSPPSPRSRSVRFALVMIGMLLLVLFAGALTFKIVRRNRRRKRREEINNKYLEQEQDIIATPGPYKNLASSDTSFRSQSDTSIELTTTTR